MLVGRDVTQRDFERWACRREMDPIKFHKSKFKVLHMGQGSPKHKYRLCRLSVDSSSEKNDMQLLVDNKTPHGMPVCVSSPERQPYPGVYHNHDQQVKVVGSTPLLCFGEIPSGHLHPALGSSAQDR